MLAAMQAQTATPTLELSVTPIASVPPAETNAKEAIVPAAQTAIAPAMTVPKSGFKHWKLVLFLGWLLGVGIVGSILAFRIFEADLRLRRAINDIPASSPVEPPPVEPPKRFERLSPEQTSAFQWRSNYADRFGFELSFPRDNPQGIQYEPWHRRSVGSAQAAVTFEPARSLNANDS